MKMVFNKATYLKTFLAVIGLLILLWISSGIFSDLKEDRLMKKYRQDPERKQFVEWIERDLRDLDSDIERPHRIGATMDVGLQWYNLREFDLAAKWWEKGLKIESNNDIGWYNLGNAYREIRKFRSAEKAYRKSMEIATPGEIDACLGLGEMYRYMYVNKKDKEDDVYLECLKKHTNNRDLIARLAIYYRDSGDIENAEKYFDKLFSIEPTVEVSEELRNLRLRKNE